MNDKEWQLVPRELTGDMADAGIKARINTKNGIDSIWKAMLLAAPQPPEPGRLSGEREERVAQLIAPHATGLRSPPACAMPGVGREGRISVCTLAENELYAEIKRLRRDCAEAYQVIGCGMLGEPHPGITQKDVERALDNLSAAMRGLPRPHEDLLPWPGVGE